MSGASFVYLLFLSAGVFIVSYDLLQESSLPFFISFIIVIIEIFIPLWPVTLAICSELTIFAFFSLLTVVFLLYDSYHNRDTFDFSQGCVTKNQPMAIPA